VGENGLVATPGGGSLRAGLASAAGAGGNDDELLSRLFGIPGGGGGTRGLFVSSGGRLL
jgi:hypothetical protein